jgi:hypothetical protein
MTGAHITRRIDRILVAKMLHEGLSNLQIADRLNCAPNTICMLKKALGFAIQPYKPRAHKPRPIKRTFTNPSGATKYSTERTHLALQIAEWPAGIHFEDAVVPAEAMFRGTPPAFGISLVGNSSAMCAAKLGFI